MRQSTIIAGFLNQAKLRPDAVALKEAEKTLSYSDLYKRVAQLHYCISQAASDSTTIGIYAHDNFNMVAGILAICASGAAYVPLSAASPTEQSQYVIDELGLSLILTEKNAPTFSGCEQVMLDDIGANESVDLQLLIEQDLAYVLYTSGSTGKPKGVPISKEGLLDLLNFFQKTHQINEQDRFLQCADWSFDLSVWTLFLSLNSGASCVCLPNKQIAYVEALSALREEKITCVNIVPSLLQFSRSYFDELKLEDLRLCVFAGEALPADLARAWNLVAPNCRIENHYGLTEATVHISRYEWQKAEMNERQWVSIGKIYPHLKWAFRDLNGQISTTANAGELLITGSQVIDHYINEQYPERFVDFDLLEQGKFFCTGDWLEKDQNNNLHFIKRIDRQFQLNGYRIEPSEIEMQISKQLNRKSIVFRDTEEGQVDVLFAVLEGAPLSKKDCTTKLKQVLAIYKVPSRFEFIDQFPLNKNGKVDRKLIENKFKRQ